MLAFDTVNSENYPSVARIYEEGIATGNATFQEHAYAWEEWDRGHLQHSRLLALDEGNIIGWAALSPVSSRCVYEGVAEVGIYMAASSRGKGYGTILLEKLIESSEANGIWTLQSGIFPENIVSIRLHEKCGFRIVGYRERIGQMNGTWRNTVLLERRSSKTG
jgi:L-amino acid N-acyltransferase YncA